MKKAIAKMLILALLLFSLDVCFAEPSLTLWEGITWDSTVKDVAPPIYLSWQEEGEEYQNIRRLPTKGYKAFAGNYIDDAAVEQTLFTTYSFDETGNNLVTIAVSFEKNGGKDDLYAYLLEIITENVKAPDFSDYSGGRGKTIWYLDDGQTKLYLLSFEEEIGIVFVNLKMKPDVLTLWDGITWDSTVEDVLQPTFYTRSEEVKEHYDIRIEPTEEYIRFARNYIDDTAIEQTRFITYSFDETRTHLMAVAVSFGKNGKKDDLYAYLLEAITENVKAPDGSNYTGDEGMTIWFLDDDQTKLYLASHDDIISVTMVNLDMKPEFRR